MLTGSVDLNGATGSIIMLLVCLLVCQNLPQAGQRRSIPTAFGNAHPWSLSPDVAGDLLGALICGKMHALVPLTGAAMANSRCLEFVGRLPYLGGWWGCQGG